MNERERFLRRLAERLEQKAGRDTTVRRLTTAQRRSEEETAEKILRQEVSYGEAIVI